MSNPSRTPDEQTDIFALFSDPEDDGIQFPVQPAQPTQVKGELERQFEAFHRLNPHVYEAIVEIALDLKKGRGFWKGGMKMIFERLRWLYAIQTRGEEYKLNNNYTAFYARVVMATVPELDGFFETRLHKGEDPYVPDLVALGFQPKD
jgi:hypothetical protein